MKRTLKNSLLTGMGLGSALFALAVVCFGEGVSRVGYYFRAIRESKRQFSELLWRGHI